MSNNENDKYIESLYDRAHALDGYITVGTLDELHADIVRGDLEAAGALMDTLEAIYAEDLR